MPSPFQLFKTNSNSCSRNFQFKKHSSKSLKNKKKIGKYLRKQGGGMFNWGTLRDELKHSQLADGINQFEDNHQEQIKVKQDKKNVIQEVKKEKLDQE